MPRMERPSDSFDAMVTSDNFDFSPALQPIVSEEPQCLALDPEPPKEREAEEGACQRQDFVNKTGLSADNLYRTAVATGLRPSEYDWIPRQRQKWHDFQAEFGGFLPDLEEFFPVYQRWHRSRARFRDANGEGTEHRGLLDRASQQVRHTLATISEKADPRCRHFSKLVRAGVPPELRGRVWWLCSGAGRLKNSCARGCEYRKLVERAVKCPPKAAQEIEKDLHRTFPNMSAFETEEGIANMRRVLLAYSLRNVEVGYCQSLNFLVAMLLLHMDEEEAFWVLAAIVEDLVPDYYTEVMVGSHVDQKVFQDLLAERLPALHAHFLALNLQIEPLTFKWFLCLFVNTLPLDLTLRIWDCFFHEGSKVLFRVGLTLLKVNEEKLLSTTDPILVYELLRAFDRNSLAAALSEGGGLQGIESGDPHHCLCDALVSASHDKAWIGGFTSERIQTLQAKHRPAIQKHLLESHKRREKRKKSTTMPEGSHKEKEKRKGSKALKLSPVFTSVGRSGVESSGTMSEGADGDDYEYDFVDEFEEEERLSERKRSQDQLETSFMLTGEAREANGGSERESFLLSKKENGLEGNLMQRKERENRGSESSMASHSPFFSPHGRVKESELHMDIPFMKLNTSPMVNIQVVKDKIRMSEVDALPSLNELEEHPPPALPSSSSPCAPSFPPSSLLSDRQSASLSTVRPPPSPSLPVKSIFFGSLPLGDTTILGSERRWREATGRRESFEQIPGVTAPTNVGHGKLSSFKPAQQVESFPPAPPPAEIDKTEVHAELQESFDLDKSRSVLDQSQDTASEVTGLDQSQCLERSGYTDPRYSYRFRSLAAYLEGSAHLEAGERSQELLIENYYG